MKIEWKTCYKVGISIFLLYLCTQYWMSAVGLVSALVSAASPLIIGCIIAYLVNILMSLYERHYFPHSKRADCHSIQHPAARMLPGSPDNACV